MKDNPMADGAFAADNGRMTIGVIAFLSGMLGNVEQAEILDVGAGTDANAMDITPDNDPEPEGHVLSKDGVADERGIGRNPAALTDLRLIITVWQYHVPSSEW
jgi:hypothetical protein